MGVRTLATALAVLSLFAGTALAADKENCPTTVGDVTGQGLLDRLSSGSQDDFDWALGYVMGAYGVHVGDGALPPMDDQKRIAATVKKHLEAARGRLGESASVLLKEIFSKEYPPTTAPKR